jgi:Protein of unknown function (DUF1592)/Protein of unknown function (DUF1588)/Protein of unknown function (DUF1595)/Protein of unknown function (DUF1587)
MVGRFKILAATLGLLGAAAFGCAGRDYQSGQGQGNGSGGSGSGSGSGSSGGSGNNGSGGGSGNNGSGGGSGSSGNNGSGGSGSSSGGGTGGSGGAGASGVDSSMMLTTDLRRLTNAEYDASVQALFGTKQTPAASTFAADSTQSGYTLNEGQVVASQMAKDLDTAAISLVSEARGNGTLASLSPCSSPTTGGAACAMTFINTFGAQVYRRPVTSDEATNLATVYQAAVTGDTGSSPYNDGIDLVTRTMLQSPGFLYVTELGPNPPSMDPSVTLTPYEMASTMSYLLTAGPPDSQLMQAAAAGNLSSPDDLETQARRLLSSSPGAPARLVRLVREWLGIDSIGQIAKDMNWYPDFTSLNAAAVMDDETTSFINEVLQKNSGTVSELLSAPYTIISPTSAVTSSAISSYYSKFYGVTGSSGEVSLAGAKGGARIGILNQGAFSSVYAHASTSGPVLRGVAVMRRVACIAVPDPSTLNITVPPPPAPDASNPETTRALFNVHGTTPVCSSCHTNIDAFGFTFEGYDGMGEYRTIDADSNGQVHLGAEKVASTRSQAIGGYEYLTIDTSTTVSGTQSDLDASYTDSNALATALAGSSAVAACAPTQLFRGSTGRSDATGALTASEMAFQTIWSQLSSDKQGNITEILVAYIRSPLFSQRSTM